MKYSAQQNKYIELVGGKAHAHVSALKIIGLLEKVIKTQSRLLIAYRVGGKPPEWVFETLEKAKGNGVDC